MNLMDDSKKNYSLKPAKKFFKIRFLFFAVLIILLIFLQTFICLTSPFYLYLGIFLIPLSGVLIFVFYNYYYRNPLKNEIRLDESLLFINTSTRNKSGTSSFKLNPKKINNILLHQALFDKIFNLRTISMKILLKNGYLISNPHFFFNKESLLFLKMLFKSTDLEKKQFIIDMKMNPDFVKILTKIIK